jgi:hypothetical protein
MDFALKRLQIDQWLARYLARVFGALHMTGTRISAGLVRLHI